jgi:hypothetical protein
VVQIDMESEFIETYRFRERNPKKGIKQITHNKGCKPQTLLIFSTSP